VIDLDEAQCAAVLEGGRVAHLGCISNGEVYVTPLSYVVLDGVVYSRTMPGRRTRALQENPDVCLEVSTVLDPGWQSVVLWGRVEFIGDGAVRERVVGALLAKYHSNASLTAPPRTRGPIAPVVLAIAPDRMEGRASGGGLTPSTRPGRL
jgi:nitroimidazol reductase NimA-like FMN-containing flavoprotein (pyridoxamine 5'-phosphate oxidase superfamily)